ncbi:hypothetical protein ROZALSC1DRAFT_27611 [Rozella allomycis CSF55]|uniref:Uncharacterized protein n=1 Tax=Rozella allomycis (strain CSF55) TaxID=988480 RepID=A0A075B2D2_ROZAC|nr:hypothetical protein O9G_006064 [Rozella allomycis CSF55]RKP20938.1 hypothetical protein ROZALSC1DRAFT_27611 [Rozella allomycis CSF55]|eukprot:EPZ36702.1 hypothetical protein O9G_006064 [Rozella allomycis CSF55]
MTAVTIGEANTKLIHIEENGENEIGISFPHICVPLSIDKPVDLHRTKGDVFLQNNSNNFLTKFKNFLNILQTDEYLSNIPLVKERLPKPAISNCATSEKYAPVLNIAWHKYRQVLALVHRQDLILVYDLNVAGTEGLVR